MLTGSVDIINVSGNDDNTLTTGSLEEMLRSAFTHHVAADYKDKMEVLNSANDPTRATDIDNIYQYQLRTSDYNIRISLYSTLVRKGVTAIDTIIRA